MNYFLIRLAFDTAIHFGPSNTAQSLDVSEGYFCADTLFSALCHTALDIIGPEGPERLCQWVKDDELFLSDAMPWHGADCFLPKPMITSESRQELPASLRKAMKKLRWIPVKDFAAFTDSVHGGEPYDPSDGTVRFGSATDVVKAAVRDGEDTVPYRVGLYQFSDDSGLYLIMATRTVEQGNELLRLFRALGMTGIGGKVSSGYGKFHLEKVFLLNDQSDSQSKWLYHALTGEGCRKLLLTSSLPMDDELKNALDGAEYQLIRRGGFVASEIYAETPMKKKTQHFLRAGSTFSVTFKGELYNVGTMGNHPVFRYGKPLFLEVDL